MLHMVLLLPVGSGIPVHPKPGQDRAPNYTKLSTTAGTVRRVNKTRIQGTVTEVCVLEGVVFGLFKKVCVVVFGLLRAVPAVVGQLLGGFAPLLGRLPFYFISDGLYWKTAKRN